MVYIHTCIIAHICVAHSDLALILGVIERHRGSSLGACVRACVFAVYLNSNHLQCVGMRSRTHKYAL